MSSTLNYVGETDLENLLLVDIDSSFSTQIDTWISAAEERVNNYTGYTTASGFWNESITGETSEARVDGDMNLVIHTRKRPINSVSALEIVKGSESTTISLTDGDGNNRYTIPSTNEVLVYPSFELTTSSSVILTKWSDIKYSRFYTKLDYIAGYTTIPGPVKLATTMFTADIFMRQANKEGLVAITQGRVTKRWAETRDGESNFVKEARRLLNPYRIASGWI